METEGEGRRSEKRIALRLRYHFAFIVVFERRGIQLQGRGHMLLASARIGSFESTLV